MKPKEGCLKGSVKKKRQREHSGGVNGGRGKDADRMGVKAQRARGGIKESGASKKDADLARASKRRGGGGRGRPNGRAR